MKDIRNKIFCLLASCGADFCHIFGRIAWCSLGDAIWFSKKMNCRLTHPDKNKILSCFWIDSFCQNNVDNAIIQKLIFFPTKTLFGQKYGKNQHHKTLEGWNLYKSCKNFKLLLEYLFPVPNDSHFKTAQFFLGHPVLYFIGVHTCTMIFNVLKPIQILNDRL